MADLTFQSQQMAAEQSNIAGQATMQGAAALGAGMERGAQAIQQQANINTERGDRQQQWQEQRQDNRRQQQQNALKTTLAERGIPLGSEIEQNEAGNLNRQFAIADQNAAAQAWNAVPGMQSQLQSNQIQQQMAPGAVANQSLGLLGGLAGLTPGYTNIAPQNFAPGDFAGAQARADQQNAQNYNNMWSGIGSLAKIGGAAFGGPLGAAALGGLFGSSSTTPGTAQNGGWTTTVNKPGLFNWPV